MSRDFDDWLNGFKDSISTYDYYVNFEKVYGNIDKIKIELNILNSLICSKNIQEDFISLANKYPEVIKCIPILLAVREYEVYAQDETGEHTYVFNEKSTDIANIGQCAVFMKKTGLFNLLSNHIIKDLVDYVMGVEVGLDSNGRKNRGGHLMEDVVERYIKQTGCLYHKEMKLSDVQKKWGLDLSALSNDGKTEKRFDFVVEGEQNRGIFAIETNFYKGGGSKLNETARSYKGIATESKGIEKFSFMWITDGKGWISARNNLRETFEVMEHIYNIGELKEGVLNNAFK